MPAVARETTRVKLSKYSGCRCICSARAFTTVTCFSWSNCVKCSHAFVFFPTESKSTIGVVGWMIARGMPGNPPHVPISSIRFSETSKNFSSINESTKCFSIIACGSRIAERLVWALYIMNASRNWENFWASSWDNSNWCRQNISTISSITGR